MKSLIIVFLAVLLAISGCTPHGQTGTGTGYTGPTISGYLAKSNWQRIDTSGLETLLGHAPPLPTYLPAGYQIREGYYYHEPNSVPQATSIVLLISDQPVEWKPGKTDSALNPGFSIGDEYVCRMMLFVGWNEAGMGLKGVSGESIAGIGKLQQTTDEYILWLESYGSSDSLGSTLTLTTSRQFSRDELIKIAASIPGIAWPP